MLHKICETLLGKHKVGHGGAKETQGYQTPAYSKQPATRFASCATLESEPHSEPKLNREKVGRDLKLQWSEMMKEFELGAKKTALSTAPLCSDKV